MRHGQSPAVREVVTTHVDPNASAKAKEKEAKLESQDTHVDAFQALKEEEQDHQIQYRTLSWPGCALLLFGEYVCLAILALAWSWSVVGWVSHAGVC